MQFLHSTTSPPVEGKPIDAPWRYMTSIPAQESQMATKAPPSHELMFADWNWRPGTLFTHPAHFFGVRTNKPTYPGGNQHVALDMYGWNTGLTKIPLDQVLHVKNSAPFIVQ